MFAWLFLSFRKFKQQTSVLHLQQVLARSRGIMPCSNNRNDLSGEPFRKPSPPPTPNNRTAWKKIQATWDACFLGAQASKAQALTLFQRFGPIPWKPDAQWCHAGCCSQAVRWERAKLLHFAVAFHMSGFEQVQLRQYTLQRVCCSPVGRVKEGMKKILYRVFPRLLS